MSLRASPTWRKQDNNAVDIDAEEEEEGGVWGVRSEVGAGRHQSFLTAVTAQSSVIVMVSLLF